ncbi:MAG: hypothetical protein V4772_18030 [Pseudomonadota bacterium]
MTSTNLLNLARIGLLEPVPLSAELVSRMLTSAKQRLRDAEFTQNSAETRFDCAYTAIRTVADIGLHLQGFRTSTSKPGHHQTAIQCLAHTLGLDASTIRLLDGLRKQRNVSEYDGELVTDAVLSACLEQAKAVVFQVQQLLVKHPEIRIKPE